MAYHALACKEWDTTYEGMIAMVYCYVFSANPMRCPEVGYVQTFLRGIEIGIVGKEKEFIFVMIQFIPHFVSSVPSGAPNPGSRLENVIDNF
jgi:hypothetical protein